LAGRPHRGELLLLLGNGALRAEAERTSVVGGLLAGLRELLGRRRGAHRLLGGRTRELSGGRLLPRLLAFGADLRLLGRDLLGLASLARHRLLDLGLLNRDLLGLAPLALGLLALRLLHLGGRDLLCGLLELGRGLFLGQRLLDCLLRCLAGPLGPRSAPTRFRPPALAPSFASRFALSSSLASVTHGFHVRRPDRRVHSPGAEKPARFFTRVYPYRGL
jgi:hypothetical protein